MSSKVKYERCQKYGTIRLLVIMPGKGRATLQLSMNRKTNQWALTSLFNENAPDFGSIRFEGIFGFVCAAFSKKYL